MSFPLSVHANVFRRSSSRSRLTRSHSRTVSPPIIPTRPNFSNSIPARPIILRQCPHLSVCVRVRPCILAPTSLHAYIHTFLIPCVHIAQMPVQLSCYFQNSKILLLLIKKELTIFTPQNFRIIRERRAHIRRAQLAPARPPPRPFEKLIRQHNPRPPRRV